MIPEAAVEAAAAAMTIVAYDSWGDVPEHLQRLFIRDARIALEAAAPHIAAHDEAKLAAIIVTLDPFERVTEWMTTDDEAGRYALEAVHKIRAILDGAK